MLNTFPDLLSYSILAPLILRIVLGLIAINLGFLKWRKEKAEWVELFQTIHLHPAKVLVKILSLIEIVGGLLLIVGGYAQITAIVFAVVFFCEMILEYREESLENRNLPFYVLLFAISLSLIFLGAGAFAFDLPL